LKIAIVTDDGTTISRHFGRAEHYAALTVESGQIGRELRPKFSPHATLAAHEEPESGPHGTSPQAQARHDQMAASIADCSALLCGGMGQGASERIAANGIRPIVTDIEDVDEAALACAAGTIVDHAELRH
jgi:predicted Fe-Mo cluster-binding NifX family protein